MVFVRPVSPADFEQLYPLLDWHDPALGKAVWRRIFDYAWEHDEPHCGYGLFEGNEAVGFIGFVFCDRPSNFPDKTHRFCNLTTWVVKPQYRGHSLSLMMPVMRMRDYTVTDLSAGDDVIKVSKRLGFKVLDDAVQILLPQLEVVKGMASIEGRIFEGEAIAHLSLAPTDLKVFKDHLPYSNCHQLVLTAGEDYCHVLYTLNRDDELSYAHVQSISNLALFEQHQAVIRQRIIRRSGIPLIAIDSRLVSSVSLPFSYRLPLSSPRIYRSSVLAPKAIDNLYSELTLLDFGTADALTLGWREKALSVCSPAMRRLAG